MKGNEMNTKLEYYLDKKIKIHLTCSKNIFYNGFILRLAQDKDLIEFIDDKLGEIPVLFEEIDRIEPYKEACK
jgi:hypothetical protein